MAIKRLFKLLPVAAFFVMFFAVTAIDIVQEDKTYSSVENRMLQKFPKLSAKEL